MPAVVYAILGTLSSLFRSRLSLQVEIVALRHQLAIYKRSGRRPHLRPADRILWSWLSRHWATWREALVFVQPATVIAWQRKRFRDHWTRLSSAGKPGRPRINNEIRELIRNLSGANPLWGTPCIVGELGKLGIKVAKSTVDKYRVRSGKTPSPTWKAFLKNHVNDLVSIDFFIVPTIRFKFLFVLVVLAHSRRKVLHFNITENPTAQWTAQQIVEAFPWKGEPEYLLRDRDDRLLLRMPHQGRDQAARDRHRDADIGALVLEHTALGPGDVGVRDLHQRERHRLDDEVVD